jgi:hypothetical protein
MKKAIPFLLLVIFFIAAVWYSLLREPDPVHEIPPPTLVPKPAVQESPYEPAPVVTVDEEPAPEPEPLPELQESDAEITADLAKVTDNDAPAQYIVKDQVIRRLVAVIDSLNARQVPPPANPVSRPPGAFIVTTQGDSTTIGTQNAARYDAHVALLQQVDATALNALYDRYEPLFQQAWQENGGDGSFKDRLVEIIDHLLATPEVTGKIELVKPEAVYLYADPELEALSAGQKILLRMGPENAATVKAKLVEIRELLLTDTATIKFKYKPEEDQ